jgi:AcrR family transcriptional regulator
MVAKERVMATASMSKRRQEGGDETAVRERILEAAFAAFMKSGYATASTLEIATRARVSKRELYALVGNKQEMLIACISERAKRFDVPATPQPPSCNFTRYRMTCQPVDNSLTKSFAVANPIPSVPPAMTAVLPSGFSDIVSSLCCCVVTKSPHSNSPHSVT